MAKNVSKEFYYWREKIVNRIKERGLLHEVDHLEREKLEDYIK